MPSITNPPFFSITILRSSIFTSKSRFFSSLISPIPTQEQIADLILDQKSPTQSIQTFRWATNLPNFTHTQSTYRALIHMLCTFRQFDTAFNLLDEMPHTIASPPDETIFLTIVRGLGRAKMIKKIFTLLDLVSRFDQKGPPLKLLNSVLDVLVKDDIDLAREFYRKIMMKRYGFEGDDYTYGILMKGLCLTNRIGDGFKLLQAIKNRGVVPNTVIYNTLIHALCKNGKVGRARSFMNEMINPNEVTFNIVISSYCGEENLIQALVLLDKCFNLGFSPNVITITKVLQLLCDKDRAMEGLEVLERVESKGGVVDVVFYNTLIKGFCKLGKVKVGYGFLKEMGRKGCLPSVDTYNILITGFCDLGMLDSALDMFHDMKTDAITANFVTYDTLIKGLCLKGRVDDGFEILELMEESKDGSKGRVSPYNSIIYGLYKENRITEALDFLTKMEKLFPKAVNRSVKIIRLCVERNIEDARNIYDQFLKEGGEPNVIIYVCLIHAYFQIGNTREAFELMNAMVSCRLFPIASTYNVLISAFCGQGMVESGLKLLEDMVERSCLPNIGSYFPLLDYLVSKGELEKAMTIFTEMVEMGVVPDHHIWSLMMNFRRQEAKWFDCKSISCINNLLNSTIDT